MGSCVDTCCWSSFGSRCCNIISLLGFLYFGLNYLIFPQQLNFYQYKIQDPESTRWSMLISACLYLLFFGVTLGRIWQLNRQKERQARPVYSIHGEQRYLGQP